MNCDDKTKEKIRDVVIRALNLQVPPNEIDFDVALFDGKFGLDSVDLVSAVVAVERSFNIEFPDDVDFAESFYSITTIAQAVEKTQSKT